MNLQCVGTTGSCVGTPKAELSVGYWSTTVPGMNLTRHGTIVPYANSPIARMLAALQC